MFAIWFFSCAFGVSAFASAPGDYLLGISGFGSLFGVLAALFILLGANADDPDFFMQNHIIMV